MTPWTFGLGRGVAALFVIACVLAGFWLFGSENAAGTVTLHRYIATLDRQLKFLRSEFRGRVVATAQGIAAATCLLLAWVLRQPLFGSAVPIVFVLPRVLIARATALRVAKVEQQIEPWLTVIANAMKASPSLGDAIASSVSLLEPPMSEEVDLLVKEYELGTPLDVALDNFAGRFGSRTLNGCVLALRIARGSGGSLPEMLESAAAALREMARLDGVVRTKTAEGKAQTFVIGIIPLPLVAAVNWIDPNFIAPLLNSFAGRVLLACAVILWAAAILVARKILHVDI